jgi:2-polyprenyl-3-methyl-5-hydroxy-6-metoxy-1,4-benzoquinol methylase
MAAPTASTAGGMDIGAFRTTYRQAMRDIVPFLTAERLEVIARHNPGWKPESFDLSAYLWHSEKRYVRALESFERCGGGPAAGALRVLDVGGFMGALPLALVRMGVEVTLSERYGYYYGAFDDLRDLLASEGVEIWDLDLTAPLDPAPAQRFDLVAAMAILEHLAHSPKPMLDNIRTLLEPTGRLVLDVPNVAHWPKRLAFLLGISPLAPLEHVYWAQEPFTGHHREYTARELQDVLTWSGLPVQELQCYEYWPPERAGLVKRLLVQWPAQRFAPLAELLLVCAARS